MSINKRWDSCAIDHYTSVEQIRQQLYKESCKYLDKHPEVRAIIRLFLHEVINRNPKNFRTFAASVFDSNKSPILQIKIDEHLKVIKSLLKKGEWSRHDCERLIVRTDSTHSLLSNSSIPTDIDGILRFCMLLPKC